MNIALKYCKLSPKSCGTALKSLLFQKMVFLLISIFLSASISLTAATFYSLKKGSWGTAASWSNVSYTGTAASTVPTSTDDVFIGNGIDITLDVDASCHNLTLEDISTTTGTLIYNQTGTMGLHVYGDMTLMPNSSISYKANSYNFAYPLTVDGNFTNNGTIIMGKTTGKNSIKLILTGVSKSISGTGSNFQIRCLEINAGASINSTFSSTSGIIVSDSLMVKGTLDIQSGSIVNGSASTLLSVTGNLKIGDATGGVAGSNFPSGFTINTLSGTVDYYKPGIQTIAPLTYANLTLSGSGVKTTTSVTVNGLLSLEGTATASTSITFGSGATLQYKGTDSRTTSTNELASTFNGSGGIIIDQGTNNTITLGNNVTNSGDIQIKSGTLDIGGYTLNRISAGGNLTLLSGSTLKIGGAGTLPSNYVTHAIDCNSTVVYNGTNQTVATLNSSQLYGNLLLNGTGTKTLQPGITNICQDLTIQTSVTAVTGLTVGRDFNVAVGGAFSAGSFTHNVAGNFIMDGTLQSESSTFNFNGTSAQNIAAANFKNIQFSNAGIKTATGSMNIAGNLTINTNFNNGSGLSHSLAGNFTNNGAYTPNGGSIVLNGAAAQTIGGTMSTSFYNLTANGPGAKNLGIASSVSNLLTLTDGKIVTGTYDLTVSSVAGGNSSSYVQTTGSGKLISTVNSLQTKNFPVGQSAYNPVTVKYLASSGSSVFKVALTDGVNSNSNDATKTVDRKWYVTKLTSGSEDVELGVTYNSGEQEAGFNSANTPRLGQFNGTSWTYYSASSVVGTTLTGTVNMAAADLTPNNYIVLGNDDAFLPTHYAVTSISPANPILGSSAQAIVQSQNGQGVPVCIMNPLGSTFNLTATNTALSGTPGGTIASMFHQTTVNGVIFTQTNTAGDATVTATNTSGEALSAGTSSGFQVYPGTIYEPETSGNWSEVSWRKTLDGGSNWTNGVAVPSGLTSTELLRIPIGISLNLDQTASLYSCELYGSLILLSTGTLTLNHASNNGDEDIIINGTLKNQGGVFINTNSAYPLKFVGGSYIHDMNNGSVPIASWEVNGSTYATCTVNGSSVGGLNQVFQNFVLQSGSNTLTGNMTVEHILTLTSGTITTSANYVIMNVASSLASTPGGYVNGNIRWYMPQNATTITFPVGDANAYAPVELNFTGFGGSPSGNGYLDVNTVAVQPPLASGLSQIKYVNRKWKIDNNGVTAFTSFNSSFTFQEADKIGSPTLSNLVVRKLNGNTWHTISTTPPASNTITASGMTEFSDFYIGEDNCSSSTSFWFGTTNSDWHTSSNWCNGAVPDANTDVYIPGGIDTYPSITSGNAICHKMEIATGASLTVTGSNQLEVKADFVMNGAYNCDDNSIVTLSGSSVQNISGTSISFCNLYITNASGVTASNNITVEFVLNLGAPNPTATKGCLDIGSNTLYLISSSTITGNGDVTGITSRSGFTVNKNYAFGNNGTLLYFPVVLGQTLPETFTVKMTIGSAPSWKTDAVKRYYDVASTGGSGTEAIVTYKYLSSEIPVGTDESTLSVWSKYDTNDAVDFGWSGYDLVNHTITVSGVNTALAPTSLNLFYLTIAPTSTQYLTWNGQESEEWSNSYNWTPRATPKPTVGIVIPDSTTVLYSPHMSQNSEVQYVLMAQKSSLNMLSDVILTVNGNGNAWINEANSNFRADHSTVKFTNTSAVVQLSGDVNFYNLTINSGVQFKVADLSHIKINNNFTVLGLADFTGGDNEIEFNGNNTQSIPNPNGSLVSGYHNIKFSGSGTKILPGVLNVYGNLTNSSATIDVTTNSSSVNLKNNDAGPHIQNIISNIPLSLYRLVIDNTMGVELQTQLTIQNSLQLNVNNPSATKGVLNTGVHRLIMNQAASIQGSGDVTGYIKRFSFTQDTYYDMGNKDTRILFTNVTGNVPDSVVLRVQIGTAPSWKPEAIKRIYDFIQGNGSLCPATIRTHYLDSELNGLYEGVLTEWTNGISPQQPVGPYDWGRSNNSIADNWVELVNVDIASFPTSFGNLENTLGAMSPPTNTWTGALDTDWTNAGNWYPTTVPTATSKVIIPNVSTTNGRSPLLPDATNLEVKLIYINNGGILNATSGTPLLTLNGGIEGAWTNNGTFNAGNSTIVFNNPNSVYAGTTQFNNVTFTTGTNITFADGGFLGIGGTAINNGTARAIGNVTVAYNGTGDQNIVNPDPSLNAYDGLLLTGSGIKTFPSGVDMNILGNLTISGSVTVNTAGALSVYKSFSQSAGTTFNANTYTHHFKGDFTENGTFNQSTGTIVMDGSGSNQQIYGTSSALTFNNLSLNNPNGIQLKRDIVVSGLLNLQSSSVTLTEGELSTLNNQLILDGTTAGIGGITGYVKRRALTAGTYSFGNPFNSITLNTGATADSIVLHLQQGVVPSWKNNAILRTIQMKSHAGSGTANIRYHYRDTELNANPEAALSIFNFNGSTTTELIPDTRSTADNYVQKDNLDLSTLPSSFTNDAVTLARTASNIVTWNGSASTDWNTAGNWTPATVPVSTSDVVIPDANSTTNDPTLSGTATTIATLSVENGGILNGGTATQLSLAGAGAVFALNGTFNPGTSKVIVTGSSAELYNNVNFYDVEIAPACTLTVKANISVKISGTFTPLGLATATSEFAFEYDGADQNIPVPNAVNKRYFNLVLSGSGVKTMPASSDLIIYGTMTIKDGVTVNLNNNLDMRSNLIIQSGTLNLGANKISVLSNVSNAGTMTMSNGGRASITGTLTNDGTVTQSGGSLHLYNLFTNNGTFNATAGKDTLHMNLLNYGTINCSVSNKFIMGGTLQQTIDGYNPITFNSLVLSNTKGVQVLDTALVTVDTLTVNSGSYLQLPARKHMQITNIDNQAGVSGILLKSSYTAPNPSLIFANAISSPVQATVQLATKGNFANGFNNWQFVGLPVANFSKSNPILTGSFMRQFIESSIIGGAVTSPWQPVESTMTSFKGYSITQDQARIIPLDGTLNNQDHTYTMNYTTGATFAGLNLIANSYTAAIDIADLVFSANMDEEVYLFNSGYAIDNSNSGTATDSPGQYVTIPKATAGTLGLPRQISSLQGFFVHANAAGQTVSFNYSNVLVQNVTMRTPKASLMDSPQSSTLKQHTAALPQNEMQAGTRFKIKGEKSSEYLWMFTNSQCSADYDNGFDGQKFANNLESAQLFVSALGKDYQVFSTNDVNGAIISVMAGLDTELTLTAIHQTLLDKYPQGLYLKDLQNDSIVDFSTDQSEYTFNPGKQGNVYQFRVITNYSQETGISKTDAMNFKVYSNEGNVFITGGNGDKTEVQILDLSGRLVYAGQHYLDLTTSFNPFLNQGYYIIKILPENAGVYTQKFLVR